VPLWLIVAIVAATLPRTATAQPASVSTRPTALGSPFLTTNPTIRASLDRIAKESATWRESAQTIGAKGGRVIVLTSDQVVVAPSGADGPTERFDAGTLAEVAPIVNPDSSIQVVLVVINIGLLNEAHRRQESLPAEFDTDLDRILIHEVFGHAVPYLLAGDASGRCPDPAPGEAAVKACSIVRENLVRAEMRLGRRTDYGLSSLTLSRRDRR
jgi:hypothetical protein